jgi:hypothetical protein
MDVNCAAAAKKLHLYILKWARENGCPWNKDTVAAADKGGHLSILHPPMGEREWLPLEHVYLCCCCCRWTSLRTPMDEREWM